MLSSWTARRSALRVAALVLLSACAVAAARAPAVAGGLNPDRPNADRPSPDPYEASLDYARCMRAHGVPHPDPDAHGDFRLTPKDEQRLRSVPRRTRKAAQAACYHTLKALGLKPLSPWAVSRAKQVLRELSACLAAHGYRVGRPTVRNLGLGRAFFGFTRAPRDVRGGAAGRRRLREVQHACEQRVDMAKRIDRIIALDRAASGA